MKQWFEEVRNSTSDNIVIGVVGNKIDLLGKSNISHGGLMDGDEARKYAKSIGAVFGMVSAKNSEGVHAFFVELARKISEVHQ